MSRNIKNIQLQISLLLVFTITFSGCVSNTYIISRLQENEEIYDKFVGKKVQIHKQNDELISGYFCEMKKDSIVISLNNNKDSKLTISELEIKFIKLKEAENTAALAAIIFVFVLFILSVPTAVVGS